MLCVQKSLDHQHWKTVVKNKPNKHGSSPPGAVSMAAVVVKDVVEVPVSTADWVVLELVWTPAARAISSTCI